jgi:hypothetical protein
MPERERIPEEDELWRCACAVHVSVSEPVGSDPLGEFSRDVGDIEVWLQHQLIVRNADDLSLVVEEGASVYRQRRNIGQRHLDADEPTARMIS